MFGMNGWNKDAGGDLISRAAVLEELADLYWTEERFLTFKNVDSVFDRIKALPSAQLEIVRCKDCKHRYIDGENVRYNVCDLNHNKVQGDYWYCADGERKDD